MSSIVNCLTTRVLIAGGTLLVLGCWQAGSAEPPETAPAAARDTFYFIPHTHWEGAVFKTREAYLDMGLPNILRALQLLQDYPDYRFVLDQVCYVKPFLERYPEEREAFLRFVREGRLEIVGGTDTMLDVNMPSGESFVRQVLYGKGYYRKALGVDVTVGWQLDTFGHHAQVPQLMRLGGYQSFWFFRGVASWETPSEFLWEGLDGTRIPAFWQPHSYAITYGSPGTLPEFTEFMKARFDMLAPFARGPGRVGLAGADVCQPEVHVPVLVEQFNQLADVPFRLQLAVPTEFEKAVAERGELPVVTGELNPIFQGAYSSRIELKQRTRQLEYLLTTAEKLGVLLRSLGNPIGDAILWRAWEPMLFNQAHDLMSGVMTDHVHDDTIRGYDFSQRVAEEEVHTRWRRLTQQINTQGPGIPLAVFNMLSWPRTDIALARVGFAQADARDVRLTAPDGSAVPVQVLSSERYANGSLLTADIAFVARDVPAVGYAVYRLEPVTSPPEDASSATEQPVLENEFYRLTCDPESGALTSLRWKSDGWEALRGPANVVAREEDHGDLWEPYKPLDGGSRIAMTTEHGVPTSDKAVFSHETGGAAGTFTHGSVVSEFRVERPFGQRGTFATVVRSYAGLPRIDIHTEILNEDQFVRYRALFPTSISAGGITQEIPFGAVTRPAGIEFPAQNWMDYGDGQHGLALLNRGLPGNNVSQGTMMLSLLRSTRIVAYGFGGGYEPGMTSDSGFELGKKFNFDYALVPHGGSWSDAAIQRRGWEFNQPLMCCTVGSHHGRLPNEMGFVDVSPENVVLSALKSGPRGSAIVRVYESAGSAVRAKVRLAMPVASAQEVNLMEDDGPSLEVVDNSLQLEMRPFEIKTIKLELRALAEAAR